MCAHGIENCNYGNTHVCENTHPHICKSRCGKNKHKEFYPEGKDDVFTDNALCFLCNFYGKGTFFNAVIHYDGYVDEETVIKVKACLQENHLIVWLPFDNKITAWCTMPKATPERCAMVKKYAELGVWILHEEEDRALAETMGADIIETTGSLKP